jgi:hypothetical protein
MSPLSIFSRWTETVKWLLPDLHGHTQKSLAAFSYGMAVALDCRPGHAALEIPGPAKPRSVIRRFERLLAHPHLHALSLAAAVARKVLRAWEGGRLELILDETPLSDHLHCLKLSVRYRGRALPLIWRCYPPDAPPLPLPDLVVTLLQQVPPLLPPRCQPILLCDRGLAWPQTLDAARKLGLGFVFRLQKDVRARLPDGSVHPLHSLLEGGAVRCFTGGAEIFKDAGWRTVNLVLVWQDPPQEPWLLATSLPADRRACGVYRRRMCAEESYRDEKSSGFDWQRSRVRDPRHADRLLLAMALATLWITSVGTQLVKRGLRTRMEPKKRRLHSVFGLGWRWMKLALRKHVPFWTCVRFYPPPLQSLPPPAKPA